MFLKSEIKTDRKPAVKITLQYKRSSAFCEKGKIARKKFQRFKERSFDLLSFEGKRIDVGAKKPKLRRFEIRAFCVKMRSFCTISASTFWKIQPEEATKRLSLRDFASSGHVSTLAIAKVHQNAFCCLILIFQRTN